MRKNRTIRVDVKEYSSGESKHDVVIRYLSLVVIVTLFILDTYHSLEFEYYSQAYAVLGLTVLVGKKDLVLVIKLIKKW